MRRWTVLVLGLLFLLTACGVEEPLPSAAPTQPVIATDTQAPTVTDAPTEPDAETLLRQRAQALLDGMTAQERVCQFFIVTPQSLTNGEAVTEANDALREALERLPVGGIICFADNLESREQTAQLIAGAQRFSRIPLFVGVDEEGGLVARVSDKLGTTAFAPMAQYGAAGDAGAVRDAGATIAADISAFGFNLDFAPVADVVTNPNNREIGNRSFSSDPAVAAEMVAAMVDGLQSGGVLSCLKHFPGHGSTEADSHKGASVTQRTADELRGTELVPFRAGIAAGAGLVMISHMSAPNVTGSDVPCDLSPVVVTDLLRGELGFAGVVITDSHEMGAITDYYTPAEAAVLALQAGCDIVLMPENLEQAVQGVLDAAADGSLTQARIDESVLRILTLKLRAGICE